MSPQNGAFALAGANGWTNGPRITFLKGSTAPQKLYSDLELGSGSMRPRRSASLLTFSMRSRVPS